MNWFSKQTNPNVKRQESVCVTLSKPPAISRS